MLRAILSLLRSSPKPAECTLAVLRNERTESDTRYLAASFSPDGDLVVEGQDLGSGVEAAFGCREYEWTWTVANANLPRLAEALGASSDLLRAMERRFCGPAAAHLMTFLQENQIPFKSWSRIGD